MRLASMVPEFRSAADVAAVLLSRFGARLAAADAVIVPNDEAADFDALHQAMINIVSADVSRSGDGAAASLPSVSGHVIVVTVGVVTGRTVCAIAAAAREGGARTVELLAGVLPRDAGYVVERSFDAVEGVVTPLVRRDLRWHVGD